MKAVILAGRLGTRLSKETSLEPKPMVEIGGKPILWQILKMYSSHGINDFVICCGYKGLAGAYNFGPPTQEAYKVCDVIELARTAYSNSTVQYGDGTEGPHEAGWLALEIAKARQTLGFEPRLSLVNAVQRTMTWYRSQHSGFDARKLCENDIAMYEESY
jgi:hypothetical protein